MEVLVINLDRATDRWHAVQTAAITACPPDVPLVRVAATDGATLSEADLAARVAPSVLVYLRERWRLCDPLVLSSLGAVGASCSHVRCWERVAGDQGPPCALILEDDVCLTPELIAAARTLSVDPTAWDAVLLGWHWMPSTVDPWRTRRPVVLSSALALTTWERDSCGAHAYMVSRSGARRLLRHAHPLELHVDHYLAVAAVLGLVRGYAWPENLAGQCLGGVQAAIPHWEPHRLNAKVGLPDAALGSVLLVLLGTAVAVIAVLRR